MYAKFTEESKMAAALTPWCHFQESHVTDEEPETVVSASLQKIKSIKNPVKHFLFIFYFIKSETSDSLVNHFDGHFAYLKTLDFKPDYQVRPVQYKYIQLLQLCTYITCMYTNCHTHVTMLIEQVKCGHSSKCFFFFFLKVFSKW